VLRGVVGTFGPQYCALPQARCSWVGLRRSSWRERESWSSGHPVKKRTERKKIGEQYRNIAKAKTGETIPHGRN
jgi:hypothetical protein